MVDVSTYGSKPEPLPVDLQRQIDELRSEVERIADSIRSLGEPRDDAPSWYDSASNTALRAGNRLRDQATAVSETVHENSTVITTALAVGLAVGLFVGFSVIAPARRWRAF